MADLLWSLVDLGDNIGLLFTWFFLISFLYNLSASINKADKNLLQLSLIMLVSYTSSLCMERLHSDSSLKLFLFLILLYYLGEHYVKSQPPLVLGHLHIRYVLSTLLWY